MGILFFSWFLAAFGVPQFFPLLGPLSAACAYALFFSTLLDAPSPRKKFWLGLLWYGSVQGVQLFWALGHPFYYIYAAYFLHLFLLGAQFGLLSLFVTRERISSLWGILALSGLWAILEWSRLFFLSGHPWNPVGLALSSTLYSRQFASLMGVYGLSFWILMTNFFVLQRRWAPAAVALVLPYAFGIFQLGVHEKSFTNAPKKKIALVQTAFPTEELMRGDVFRIAQEEWEEILEILQKGKVERADLMILPELVVPFQMFGLAYDYAAVERSFQQVTGEPPPPPTLSHLAMPVEGRWKVNNAYWAQAIADHFRVDLIAGLEDRGERRENYTTAALFTPGGSQIPRYSKRVLAPMGEYIPLPFLRSLAASYGVVGTFEPGQKAQVFVTKAGPCGLSICYEENFGHLMRENRQIGAEFLANLTNDNWFPSYGLSNVHFEHARLRTVEMGIPLVRSCNTGVTAAVDSFGRDVAVLGKNRWEREHLQGVLLADVPMYSYFTLYSVWGDGFIIGFSFLSLFGLYKTRRLTIISTREDPKP